MIAYWSDRHLYPGRPGLGLACPHAEGEPFTQGIGPSDEDYEHTVKAIVLLTDGDNQSRPTSNHNISHYTAYSYVNTAVWHRHDGLAS